MDTQTLATSVAPWVTIVAGLLAVAGAIVRWRSVNRLRDALHRDLELLELSPAGVSSEALTVIVAKEAEQLRSRVVDGYRPNKVQLLALYGVVTLAAGLSLLVMLEFGGRTGQPLPDWFETIYAFIGATAATTGLLALFLAGSIAFVRKTFELLAHAFDGKVKSKTIRKWIFGA